MTQYSIYGGCLQSDVPFPALPAGHGRPAWRLRRLAGAAPAVSLSLLGEDAVDPGVTVRLWRHARGLRLHYDDSGTFDVLDGGAQIDWYPGPNARPEAVQLDVPGRVLPAALHEMGSLCLHGSAVHVAGQGLAFLAPKHHGKSTLARAMANVGAQVLSDDVVAVELDPVPSIRPAVPTVRLCPDSAARCADASGTHQDAFGKVVVAGAAREPIAPARVPLGAIYVLTPVAPGANRAAAVRTPLAPIARAMALLPHARLAPLLGGSEAAVLLDRVVRLVASARVFTLEVVRDFDRLDDAARIIRSWHASAAHPLSSARRTA